MKQEMIHILEKQPMIYYYYLCYIYAVWMTFDTLC